MNLVVLRASTVGALTLLLTVGLASASDPPPAIGMCFDPAAILKGSPSLRGLDVRIANQRKAIADRNKSIADWQTKLAAAYKSLSAAQARNDQKLVTFNKRVITDLQINLADERNALADMSAILFSLQRQQLSIPARAKKHECPAGLAKVRAPNLNPTLPAVPSPIVVTPLMMTSALEGHPPIDLSGNWILHIVNGQTFFNSDALLTGPPGGPWRVIAILRATNDSYWSSHLGYTDKDCAILLLGLYRRQPDMALLQGVRYDCQGTENGAPYHRINDGLIFDDKIAGNGWELRRP